MKPLRDWPTELPRMITRQEPESLYLDYKAREALLIGPSGNREKRALDVSKDVSAFLNSDGGTIIYGIREIASGKQRLPVAAFDPTLDGYARNEISKEDLENLITSTIQYRPGPELFCISVVDVEGRLVFIVDMAKSLQGIFQARDKLYYKRFNFKSEPMEHYEVEDVRKRAISPELDLVFGLTDTWATDVTRDLNYQAQQEEVAIHLGLLNHGQVVAETALVEVGFCRWNQPKGLTHPFAYAKERPIRIDNSKSEIEALWYRSRWTPQNLGSAYTPLFPAIDPEYLMSFPLVIPQGNYDGDFVKGTVLALVFWRIQAPNMTPKTGIHSLRYVLGRLSIKRDPRSLEIGTPV